MHFNDKSGHITTKNSKVSMKGACVRIYGQKQINVELKSSALARAMGVWGRSPRKKTRPFERHASFVVLCCNGHRETRACSSISSIVRVRRVRRVVLFL